MPHYFARKGAPIQLDEATDEIGLRFGGETGGDAARRAVRAVGPSATRGLSALPARRFGRFVMLHDGGAATSPVSTIVNALPAGLASRVTRTMPVFVERESRLKLVATEQILVRFKPKASSAARRKLLQGLGLTLIGRSAFDPARHVAIPTSVKRASRTLDLANQLVEADDVVDFAAPNFLAEVRKRQLAVPGAPLVNDPLFRRQWHLDNAGGDGAIAAADIRALGAWHRVGGGKRSIVIAIIDDGIDLDHPDLKPNLWRNPDRRARDRHGRDFVDDADPWNPRPKIFNAPFDDTDINDIHGTPCAGVAAAAGNNRKGVVGIAWNCRLLAVKILAGPDLAPNDRIADAIRYAATHADVLSCSWGVARHPDVESAISFAVTRGRRGRGCPVFVSTGNDNVSRITFPSNDPNAIAVGACNDRGRRSRYSNFGRGIAVVAPSDDSDSRRQGITTTDVHLRSRGYAAGAYCDDFGGTSSATPLAAGVAALMLSANPSLAWHDVADLMKGTAEKIDVARGRYVKGYSIRYGHGRVDAARAVAAAAAFRRQKAKGRRQK